MEENNRGDRLTQKELISRLPSPWLHSGCKTSQAFQYEVEGTPLYTCNTTCVKKRGADVLFPSWGCSP